MKNISKILIILFLSQAGFGYAQHEMSLYSATGRAGVATTMATDYQTIGINPANLGLKPQFEGKNVTFGLFETAVSAFSNALVKSDLKAAVYKFKSDEFTYQEKQQAALNFAGSALAINADVNLFGISYQSEKHFGFAFGIKERFQWFSRFNSTVSDLMFRGYSAAYFDSLQLNNDSVIENNQANYEKYRDMIEKGFAVNPSMFSKLFDGSQISMAWYREYNFSYGMGLINKDAFSLNAGIGLKYIQAMGILDAHVEDGKLVAFGSFTPRLNIDFGSAAQLNPSSLDVQKTGLPKAIGNGFGLDFGATAVINGKTKVGASIANFGSVTYTGNVYEVLDTILFDMKSAGFNSYNFFAETEKIAGQQGLFKWTGRKKITVDLPTIVRAGASHEFLNDKIEVGFDMVVPVKDEPGNFDKSVISVGADFRFLPWFHFSTGLSRGGNFDDKISFPVGVKFLSGKSGTWEAGIASRDVITYLTDNSPVISAAFGFLRFRI